MTSVGLSEPKIAVPATMTLLPDSMHERRYSSQLDDLKLTCVRALPNSGRSHAAINFDIFVWEAFSELGNFRYAALDEFLTTSP